MLDKAAGTVSYLPGMTGGVYGTLVHTAFATMVRAARLRGIGFWDVETTFGLEPDARYGSKDSIRTDVILRNDAGEIIAIYDVKTGGARLGPARVKELLAKTGAAPGTPVIEMHLTRGLIRRARGISPELSIQAHRETRTKRGSI
jgi:hypothetical protein